MGSARTEGAELEVVGWRSVGVSFRENRKLHKDWSRMNWIKLQILKLAGPSFAGSIARHIATALSGVLGSYGASQGSIEAVVTAVILYAVAQVLSLIDKASVSDSGLPPAKV